VSYLLDANALIALAWPAHDHHATMMAWFGQHARQGWATCALTQSAFVRIISQPAFSGHAVAISEVAEVLLRNTAHPKHQFLPLSFGFEQVLGTCTGGLMGHRQITDAYLMTLAIQHQHRLLTFDKGLPQLLATEAERKRHVVVL
jgi:uncharacterized protein